MDIVDPMGTSPKINIKPEHQIKSPPWKRTSSSKPPFLSTKNEFFGCEIFGKAFESTNGSLVVWVGG